MLTLEMSCLPLRDVPPEVEHGSQICQKVGTIVSKVVTLHRVALLGAFKQKQYRGVQFINTKYKYFSRHPVYYVTLESELLSIAWCVYISNKSARMLTDKCIVPASLVPVHVVV